MDFLWRCSDYAIQNSLAVNFGKPFSDVVSVVACHAGVRSSTPSCNEPRYEKTGLWGFRPGPTLTGLYNRILRWPGA